MLRCVDVSKEHGASLLWLLDHVEEGKAFLRNFTDYLPVFTA